MKTKIIKSIEEISYTLSRKDIKNINLRVQSDGTVCLSVPKKVSDTYIEKFMREKLDWIREMQIQNKKIIHESVKIDKMFKSEAKKIIYQAIKNVKNSCSIEITNDITFFFRTMKTRWGSCISQKRKITFNYLLAKLPMECVEYVVLHELVHLEIQGHQKNFYDKLDILMPNWKIRKNKMNEKKYIIEE